MKFITFTIMVTVAEVALSDSAGNIAIACSSTAAVIIIASSRYLVPFFRSFFEPKVSLELLRPFFQLLDYFSQTLNEIVIVSGYTEGYQSNVVTMVNGL